MAATLADRSRLADNVEFVRRVTGAVLTAVNTVGQETAAEASDRASRRIDLIRRCLDSPVQVASWFARAAAGWNPASPTTDIGDAFADAAAAAPGTQAEKDAAGVAAVTDTQILNYVTGAWNVVAGVRPWERS